MNITAVLSSGRAIGFALMTMALGAALVAARANLEAAGEIITLTAKTGAELLIAGYIASKITPQNNDGKDPK